MQISTALGHKAHRRGPVALTLTQCRWPPRVCVSRARSPRAISRFSKLRRAPTSLPMHEHRTHTPRPNSQSHRTKRPAVARATAGKVRCWQEREGAPASDSAPAAGYPRPSTRWNTSTTWCTDRAGGSSSSSSRRGSHQPRPSRPASALAACMACAGKAHTVDNDRGAGGDPACPEQSDYRPWPPSGRLWGPGVPSIRSECWALGRAFEHACRPVSGRASRLKNASLAEASLGLSRMQKERAHGWRGGPRQSRDERRFGCVLPHRCSPWEPKAEG
jgi:hypothetical protein